MLLQGEKKWRIQLSRPLNLLSIKTSDKAIYVFLFSPAGKIKKKTDNMMSTAF